MEIIKRFDQTTGFEVLPRRWVVERTVACLDHCLGLLKGLEDKHCIINRMDDHSLHANALPQNPKVSLRWRKFSFRH